MNEDWAHTRGAVRPNLGGVLSTIGVRNTHVCLCCVDSTDEAESLACHGRSEVEPIRPKEFKRAPSKKRERERIFLIHQSVSPIFFVIDQKMKDK